MQRITKAILFALCGFTVAANAQEKIRIAGNFAADHSSSVAIQQFKHDVEKSTNGKLSVEVFPAMQLGSAEENVTQVRAGTLQMTWVGMAFLSHAVPEVEAVSMPFLFPSRDVAFKVMDGPVGQLIDKKMEEQGLLSLGVMELGPRHVTNSRKPITNSTDLEGLKIRLQPNETHLATFQALGATPVSMSVRELYAALQQKTIDAEENPYSVIFANRFFVVQKYITNTNHFFDFIAVVANKKAFDTLSPESQKTIRAAMKSAVTAQRAAAAKADLAALAALRQAGMQYTEMPAAERDAMRKKTAFIVKNIKRRVGPDLVDRVLDEVQKVAGK